MKPNLTYITYEVELQPGEKLSLPEPLTETVGAGRWVIIVKPALVTPSTTLTRDHTAFLHSYAPEDEGLYDIQVAHT